jgi:predicted transposase YbfD/YdcC
MELIREKLEMIEDLRHSSYIEHRLSDVLIIVMCAVLCGLDELGDIVLFAQKRKGFLSEYFRIEKIPSKPTFSRILNMINGEAVAETIIEIMGEIAGNKGSVVALDGKTICATAKGGSRRSLQILTAYLTESGVVLGQKTIHEKTNEIPTFQEMLDILNISGKTITADAMHCQKETCRKIIKEKGDYVFGLKENQRNLHDDVALFFNDKINNDQIETFRTIEKHSGRIEERICRKTTDLSWLDGRDHWSNLKTIIEVRRIIQSKNTRSDETSYYISSLDATASRLLQIIREHWKIESLHWMLDVVFSEDDCAILSENGHKSLNIFRKLALLLHKRFIIVHQKKSSVKAHLLSCLLDERLLAQLCECL